MDRPDRQLLNRRGCWARPAPWRPASWPRARAVGRRRDRRGAAGGGTTAPEPTAFGPVAVGPDDSRYDSLLRGNNFRFVGRPDEIRVVGSTDQVVRAVSDAVCSGRRIAVRSGGHCFENFTADPAVRMLLDLSPMDAVGYDPGRRAFAVQPGATLGHVYRTLYKGWGVTIPAGGCPEVGAGGHFAGGGYGPLSRRYGSVVDHLHAVEVVVVDRDGGVRAVVATREPDDPHRDLWWAHTGGGGGNFGVVTRYWLRAPDADPAADPARLLPPAPRAMLGCLVNWAWDERMTEQAFTTLLRNFGRWHEANSAPGSPYAGLYAILAPTHRSAGSFLLTVQIDADLPNANGLVSDFVAALTAGTGVEPAYQARRTLPWLHPTTWPGANEPGDVVTRRYKLKAGYLRRSLTDTQLAAVHRHLTNRTGGPTGGLLLVGYGCQVDAVPSDATAVAQRDVVMKAVYQTIWAEESDDAANLGWIRAFYRDVYTQTGGVPVPDEVSDGSYINYPDVDLADPVWNTSGVPWHTLYYKDNYPRLQEVKARWDPRGVFRHALAIEPPA
ncbi:FAD-dependent oxidoreductase [Kitasatospora mediocidica]|uniref:FAD-dependent oxidoreductase n=1 Tax=Kitasatospora mediocidica TaxID=58352 RepID=UPI000A00DB94|nr:FAD-binding protein [Kitasatospora mediocidica]